MSNTTTIPKGISRHGEAWRYRWTHPEGGRETGPSFEDLEECKSFRFWVVREGGNVRMATDPRLAVAPWKREDGSADGTIDKTFKTSAEAWLNEQEGTQTKAQSIREYGWTINRCASIFGHDCDKLTAAEMNKLKDRLAKKYAPLTVRNTIRLVRAVVKFARDHKVIDRDPAPRYKYGKGVERKRKHRYLTPAEYLLIREHAPNDMVRLMMDVMIHTGMRVGEMLGLRAEQLYLDEEQPYILIDWARRPNGGYGLPKSGKSRTANIEPALAMALREWVKQTRPTNYVWPSRYRPQHSWTHCWFIKTQWKPMIDRAVAAGFEPRAGRPTPHDLRHSFASWMLKRFDLKTVSELLGHASPTITAEVYAHRVRAKYDQTVGVIGALFADAEQSVVAPVLELSPRDAAA